MTGQMYSTSEYAIRAFRSKDLFNKIITCNVNNPNEKDFDSLRELYKVLWMAHYYMWSEFGKIRVKPLKTSFSTLFSNSTFLCFKVNIQKDPYDSDVWIIETNAPSYDVASIINMLAEKSQQMANRYKSIHGSNLSDFLGTKLAGTSNRYMPLSHSSLYGDWIAVDIEGEYYPIISTRESVEIELQTPSYSLQFFGSDGCRLGGEHPDAIRITGTYDSNYNIIVDNLNSRVLAFVVSLDEKELKVVPRYKKNYSGTLIAKGDDELSVVKYQRKTDLQNMCR